MITIDTTKNKDGALIRAQLQALLEDDNDFVSGLSNTSAFLNEILEDINWVGFYLLKNNLLILGPFQGKVACTRIHLDKGVCGAAATQLKTQRIADVHKFKGHIACDSASNSELVCPIIVNDTLIGVLDIDSPSINRFDKIDQENMEAVAQLIADFYLKTM